MRCAPAVSRAAVGTHVVPKETYDYKKSWPIEQNRITVLQEAFNECINNYNAWKVGTVSKYFN